MDDFYPKMFAVVISSVTVGIVSYVWINFWGMIYTMLYSWRRPERMERLGSKLALCYTEYVRWIAEEQRPVKKFKEMSVTEQDIKNLLYGSIREITRDRRYYYDSSYRPHFTEDGVRVVGEMLNLYAEKIQQAIKEADEQRSKDMVMNALKEETK
jgi:hypothetical protein